MKSTEKSFVDKFLSLLIKYEVEEISVPLLLEESYFSRATFYYHFRSIEDVVAAYYLDEEIIGIKEVNSFKELFEIIHFYLDIHDLTTNKILKSAIADYFYAFLINQMKQGFLALNKKKAYFKSKEELDFNLYGAFGLIRQQLEITANVTTLKNIYKTVLELLNERI